MSIKWFYFGNGDSLVAIAEHGFKIRQVDDQDAFWIYGETAPVSPKPMTSEQLQSFMINYFEPRLENKEHDVFVFHWLGNTAPKNIHNCNF